ncbi:MAG: PHP domain-containing protein [Oscillospiraceae bacterium]|nr:PHP domain-containing protein [Oscillospiraceae bacterium]
MEKYKYRVETHLHTSQASACAANTGAQMARAAKEGGFCAIVVTDHFFNGNTAIRGDKYSWDEKISLFMRGYEDAKAQGDKIGLDVYFGFEYNYCGAEFLIYNYPEKKLRAYPGIMAGQIETVLGNMRAEGAFVIHAHPFRSAPYIPAPAKLFPECTDAVEVANTHNKDAEPDRLALGYAVKYGLAKFGGSDAHSADPQSGGMMFARRPASLGELIDMAKKGDCEILGQR